MVDGDDILSGIETSAEPPEEGLSVSESASAAFDALRGQPEEQSEQARADRARDEAGRFAAKIAEPVTEAERAQAQQKPPEQAAAPQMPASWGKDRAALWSTMPPEAQAYAVEREAQMAEGVKRFEGLARYDEAARANGTNLSEVMGRVQQLEDAMQNNPVQGFHMLAQTLGIDPQKLAAAVLGRPASEPSKDGAEAKPAIDPEIQARIDRLEASHRANEEARVREQRRAADDEVKAFTADPKNAFFDEVADEVAAIIRGARMQGQPITLAQAYDKAVWSVPGVREKLLARQSAEAEAKRVSETAKAATAAKAASRSLKGSSSGSQPAAPHKTVRDAAADAFERLSG